MKNYPNINQKFVNENYGFFETLAQIAFTCGELGYYPSQDSREQSSSMIQHALKFCELHQNVDWNKTKLDWLIEVVEYTHKFYVEWAESEVLNNQDNWDEEDYYNIVGWVEHIKRDQKLKF